MSNFSYTAYYAQLTRGLNGCVGRAEIQADTKHARNVNNGKLKKKRIFRFCGSKFGYFRQLHFKSWVLNIMRYCLTWSEEKQGPRRTRNRRKWGFQHKNKHKRSQQSPVSNSSLDSRGMRGMAQRISTTQIVMFTLLLLFLLYVQVRKHTLILDVLLFYIVNAHTNIHKKE